MRADYGASYRELYEHHWWWRARERAILDVLRVEQPADGWKRILDVGCGDGLFFEELSRFGEVEGVEPTEALVSNSGAHRSNIHIVSFDEKFQPGKQYSLILMLDVLEHLAEPAAALRHALDLLTPQGTLLITVPAFRLLWTNHDVINDHYTRYTKRSFGEVARQAGCTSSRNDIFSSGYFRRRSPGGSRSGAYICSLSPLKSPRDGSIAAFTASRALNRRRGASCRCHLAVL